MEIITSAICAALVDLSGTAIKDSYAAMKHLIVKKWGEGSSVHSAVKALETKPSSKSLALHVDEELLAVGAEKDGELRALAQQLLDAVTASPGGGTRVSQNISGTGHMVLGAGTMVINTRSGPGS